ncbi:MAG: DUF5625 family protein [Methylophilus sp.]|nr:DUF5625 family protein [Methylophilus sp.]
MKKYNTFFKQMTKLGFLIIMGLSMATCGAGSEYKKIPISKRVDISQPNVKTELLVHISKEDNYAFSLLFKYKNPKERELVSQLMRGKDANGRSTNGENTPISIDVYTIKDGQNVLVSIGGGDSFPTNASGLGYLKLIYNDYLMPGDYRVLIDTKAGNPKFKDIEVELYIGLAHRPK